LGFFWGLKYFKFFYEDPGSGMEIVRIQDGKKSDPGWKTYPGWKKVGSGINIPDPQHCWYGNTFTFHISTNVFFSLESPDEACGLGLVDAVSKFF
jgi:hypothetical protein